MRDLQQMIRRLDPADAPLLRTLRIRALTDSPTAFGSTLTETFDRPMTAWEHILRPEGNPFFVYEVGGDVRGLAGGFMPEQVGEAHLVSMWIDPVHRGSGISDELVNHVIDWARSMNTRRVLLGVTEGNSHAEELYFRHGFRRTGASSARERDGMIEFEMALELRT